MIGIRLWRATLLTIVGACMLLATVFVCIEFTTTGAVSLPLWFYFLFMAGLTIGAVDAAVNKRPWW